MQIVFYCPLNPQKHFSSGLVPTHLLEPTFGKPVADVLFTIMNFVKITITEEDCGVNHVNILASSNVRTQGLLLSLWDQFLISRMPPQLAESPSLGEWLWGALTTIAMAK